MRPLSVWLIFLILFLQGISVLVFTVVDVFSSGIEHLDAAGAIALVVLYLLFGVVLIVLAARLLMGASGARTPAMLLQLMMVVLSFSFFSGGLVGVGMLFLIPAATALLLLFVRPTAEWLDSQAAA